MLLLLEQLMPLFCCYPSIPSIKEWTFSFFNYSLLSLHSKGKSEKDYFTFILLYKLRQSI